MERSSLAAELVDLAEKDRVVRERLARRGLLRRGYNDEMRAVHRRNGERLSAILDELGGWPGYRAVGVQGSSAAFTIANHDIANPELMRRCRDLYEAAVAEQDADPPGLAHLVDRICMFEGVRQLYGTQLGWNDQGEFGPWPPIVQPDQVDNRRRALGLPPLAEALTATAKGQQLRRSPDEIARQRREEDEFANDVGWRS